MREWRGKVFIFLRDGREFASLIPDGITIAAYKVYGPYVPVSEEAPVPLTEWRTWMERLKEKGFRFTPIETPKWLDRVQEQRRAYRTWNGGDG